MEQRLREDLRTFSLWMVSGLATFCVSGTPAHLTLCACSQFLLFHHMPSTRTAGNENTQALPASLKASFLAAGADADGVDRYAFTADTPLKSLA